jgi:hypothetical protein
MEGANMSRFSGNGAQQQIAIGEDELIGTEQNGISAKRTIGTPMAIKITEEGTSTYIGFAVPGTAQATAEWRCMKVDESSGTVITYADGNQKFDNAATDLTALTYS